MLTFRLFSIHIFVFFAVVRSFCAAVVSRSYIHTQNVAHFVDPMANLSVYFLECFHYIFTILNTRLE